MEDSFICEKCNKNFYNVSSLKRHMKKKKPCVKSNANIINMNSNSINNSSVNLNNNSNNIKLTNNYSFSVFLNSVSPKDLHKYPTEKIDLNDIFTKTKYSNTSQTLVSNFITNLVKDEYIKDIPYEDRQIWCTDSTRNRMLVRLQDKWIIDQDSQIFKNMTINVIKKYLNNKLFYEISNNNENICKLDFESEEYKDIWKLNTSMAFLQNNLQKKSTIDKSLKDIQLMLIYNDIDPNVILNLLDNN